MHSITITQIKTADLASCLFSQIYQSIDKSPTSFLLLTSFLNIGAPPKNNKGDNTEQRLLIWDSQASPGIFEENSGRSVHFNGEENYIFIFANLQLKCSIALICDNREPITVVSVVPVTFCPEKSQLFSYYICCQYLEIPIHSTLLQIYVSLQAH